MITKFLKKYILKNFFSINLTSLELEIAEKSLAYKYWPSLRNALIYAFLALPAILFLDSNVIVSVLIPVTLVSWTAWFSISLANVRKKFEDFGMELTKDVFDSFVLSLLLLIIIATVSFFSPFLKDVVLWWNSKKYIIIISQILWTIVVFINIYKILIWSIKYDMNDAMLAWQNEAAERFFKKSLSFLQITANNLRDWKSLQVANYYIGLSFFEIFTYIKNLNIYDKEVIETYIDKSNELIDNPSMLQSEADIIAINLVNEFMNLIKNKENKEIKKSINAIEDEIKNLKKKYSDEIQAMTDTRMSVIFQEIWEMIDNAWESLFK